jgi:pyruvate dehydrogenase E2 component (dihydrolipoamide acetyltransferase)
MNTIEVKVPDIGDFKDIPVIEVFVKPGDSVKADDSLVTLESDKATMDVPAPSAGNVKDIKVKVGDKVSEGSLIVTLETDGAGGEKSAAASQKAIPANETNKSPPHVPANPAIGAPSEPAARGEKGHADTPGEGPSPTPPAGPTIEVKVPDIGDFKDVPIIEVFVKPGDIVKPDDPLVTLESEKAAMDVPAPSGGTVEGVHVAVGDKVSEGTLLLTLSHTGGGAAPPRSTGAQSASASASASAAPAQSPARTEAPATHAPAQAAPSATAAPPVDEQAFKAAHASPSVRKFARELGVDLSRVKGTGPKQRILQEDVQAFIKQVMSSQPAAGAPAPAAGGVTGGGQLNLLPWPQVDFAKFGPTETKPLSRIKRISGANLARNWVMIPHVTQFEEADITELEALRVTLNKENEKAGIKLTMLAFLIKAAVAALQRFPDFNASLVTTPEGESLTYKRYFNIGFAADTPNGLVVPVIKNADAKGVIQIAKEMGELSAKAREGKLGPADMQGGCFSISSLGGIGGTAFTPIINAPEVAILGVSKSAMKPVWDGKAFVPRLMLPLSLSYDHRVIDGASAARFTTYYANLLADLRRSLL